MITVTVWRFLSTVLLLCGLLFWLPPLVAQGRHVPLLHAQGERCIAQVYYGDGGTDQGDCRDGTAGLCATHAYALEQGIQACPELVQIFQDGRLMGIYRAPHPVERTLADWGLVLLYWMAPLAVGGFLGWFIGARRAKAVGG